MMRTDTYTHTTLATAVAPTYRNRMALNVAPAFMISPYDTPQAPRLTTSSAISPVNTVFSDGAA